MTRTPTTVISIAWHAEDIFYRANERGLSLTDEQVGNILDVLKNKHDASIGINWEVIDVITDYELEG